RHHPAESKPHRRRVRLPQFHVDQHRRATNLRVGYIWVINRHRDWALSRPLFPSKAEIGAVLRGSALIDPRSISSELSNNIIQKELAFGRDWSGTAAQS